jgi:proteic killer suppression protein
MMDAVVRSFRSKETRRLWLRHYSSRLPAELHRIAWRKLAMLDAADTLSDLRMPPGNRLERLSGERGYEHSIRINDRWRICFEWRDGDAYDVEIVDYH